MKKLWKPLCAAALAAALLAGCAPAEKTEPTPSAAGVSETLPAASEPPAPSALPELSLEELALNHLAEKYNCRAYTPANAPGEPQEGDIRLEGLEYLGEEQIYETVGVAYELTACRYFSVRNEAGEEAKDWVAFGPDMCLVLERGGYDGSWQGVLGEVWKVEDEPVKNLILRTAWGLMDAEVSLLLDGSPRLIGPGSEMSVTFPGEEPEVTVLEGWEPIYYEGDEWRNYEYKDFTAQCYYSAAEDWTTINHIETSRTDLATYRGVRVGDSRETVLSAYPNLSDGPYWGYEGDYLWYNWEEESGLGAALLFWFENDVVVKLELLNMFN